MKLFERFSITTLKFADKAWASLFRREPTKIEKVALAICLSSVSLLITAILSRSTGIFFSSFTILAVILISLYAGAWIGIFFAALMSFGNDLFAIHPMSKALSTPEEIEHFVIASAVGVIISIIIASLRNSYKDMALSKQEAENAKQDAEKANRYKTRFLATVSHEIRTPLNGIIGLSDVLRSGKLEPADQRLSELIHASGKTLLKIINDILDYSKIETGNAQLEESDFSVVDVIEQIISTLSPKAREKGILLDYEIDPKIPIVLFGDASRISQVLFNLVGNAIKFTQKGSVVLKIKTLSNEQSQSAWIQFSVSDTGIGIDLENQSRLFQPFAKLQNAGTAGEAGTGLGLSICKQILRLMNSEIAVESKTDVGSRFTFVLEFRKYSPLCVGPEHRSPRSPFDSRQVLSPIYSQAQRPMILVVEDNPTNQLTVQAMLEKLGANVLLAANGAEALDLETKTSVDLIFMDCFMPIMDGLEATANLRKRSCRLPIIAMTANASPEDRKACKDAGMDSFISKPITLDVLSDELKKFLASV